MTASRVNERSRIIKDVEPQNPIKNSQSKLVTPHIINHQVILLSLNKVYCFICFIVATTKQKKTAHTMTTLKKTPCQCLPHLKPYQQHGQERISRRHCHCQEPPPQPGQKCCSTSSMWECMRLDS